jgi:ATP-dependent Zn protease
MVAEFGMSPLGPIHLGKPEDPHSQALLDSVEKATNEIINVQMQRACSVVDESRDCIARLVVGLMERDTLDSEEINLCFGLAAASAAA